MTLMAAPRGSVEGSLGATSPGEEARSSHHAHAVMEHLTEVRSQLRDAVMSPTVRHSPVADGHDHPAAVPCIHCGLVSLNLPPVTHGVFLTLLEESRLTPEWNCVPSRRRYWVPRKLMELPTDNSDTLEHLYGQQWFDVLWVALHLELLSSNDLARFSTRLPAATRLPWDRDPLTRGLAERLTKRLSRRDRRVGGLVRERIECHLYRVSQGLLAT